MQSWDWGACGRRITNSRFAWGYIVISRPVWTVRWNPVSKDKKILQYSLKQLKWKLYVFSVRKKEKTVIVYLVFFLTEIEDTAQHSSGYSEDLNEIEY
jgi:hypothetical protein